MQPGQKSFRYNSKNSKKYILMHFSTCTALRVYIITADTGRAARSSIGQDARFSTWKDEFDSRTGCHLKKFLLDHPRIHRLIFAQKRFCFLEWRPPIRNNDKIFPVGNFYSYWLIFFIFTITLMKSFFNRWVEKWGNLFIFVRTDQIDFC